MRLAVLLSTLVVTSLGAARAGRDGAPAEHTPASPAPRPAREPRHVALLIGIADYKTFQPGGPPGFSDLSGPVNDLPRMKKSLEKWGFVEGEDMRVLRDEQASQAGFRDAFRWLAERASDTADVVVIYYSGHGDPVPDLNGDEDSLARGDRMDEALLPWDADTLRGQTRTTIDPRTTIIDDSIGVWLKRLATSNVTLIIDGCYTGTITRGATGYRPRGPLPRPGAGGSEAGATTLELSNARHTLITAASPRQTAAEVSFKTEAGDREFGVLTYYLTQALDAADSTVRYDDLMRQVRTGVGSLGMSIPPQTPQLEGDASARNALLFRVKRAVPRQPVVTVAPRADGRIVLDVGAVHGVRRSAVYDIYPAAETRFAGTGTLGQIEVDSVTQLQSFGKPIGGAAAAAIPRGAKAMLARVPPGAKVMDRLSLYVHPSAAAVRPALQQLAFISLAADSASASAIVTATGSVFKVSVNGAELPPVRVPEGYPYPPAVIAAAGRDTGYVGSVEGLCQPLRRAFSISALHQIENPLPLYLPVSLRMVPGGQPPSDLAPAGAIDTAYIGERYSLWAKVSAPERSVLYLTAAVQGYTSPDFLVYPLDQAMNQPVPLNQWFPVLPDKAGETIDATEPAGREVIKVVVGSTQFDFRSLLQSFPVQCAAASATRGWPPSSYSPPAPAPVTGWTAVERTILTMHRPAAGAPR
jgi:hypothetical protein